MDKKLEFKIKIAVFAIAFVLGMNAVGISPILGVLNESLNRSISSIQILQTVTQVLLMVGSIMIGWLTTKFRKRNIALFGLTIITIFGMIPIINDGYEAIFISRLLVGYGFGIISPLNTAIIAEYIPPVKRPAYLGLHAVGMGMGALFINVLGGYVGSFGYKYYFLMHLEAIIVIFVILKILPLSPVNKSLDKKDYRMNRSVYELSAMAFFNALFITVFATNLGIYLGELFEAGSAEVGLANGINAVFALIPAVYFSRVVNLLKRRTLPTAVFMAVIGYAALIFFRSSMIGIYIGCACLGFSLSCYMAMSSFLISVSVEKVAVAKAVGIFSVVAGFGNLLSPIITNGLTRIVFGEATTMNVFVISMFGMIMLGIVSYWVICKKTVVAE